MQHIADEPTAKVESYRQISGYVKKHLPDEDIDAVLTSKELALPSMCGYLC